ncbi:UPF0149 family protein [uncultured Thiocystis sp.]|jgi:uncharacterized protein YgfB (UPF0149 family)|uniref:UPF0149 family protein n=1 Tax=uncultured Thiocystis sp. TaxID=1202134 RepID=UPI0025CDF8BF|nr:UPF0149 family protein [uncultured Thiocystis sp.]
MFRRIHCDTEVSTDIDYDRIGRLLEVSPLNPSPGEAHGILCGLLCGGDPDPLDAWFLQLLPAAEPTEPADPLLAGVREGLSDLATATQIGIRDPDLGFRPLLPDDDRPLAERATALYDWVRGFLFAFGVLGVAERDLSAQTREILRDFADLTRMDLDDLDDAEENEEALAEVTEFIRVAAMLIHDERASPGDAFRQL